MKSKRIHTDYLRDMKREAITKILQNMEQEGRDT